LAGALLFDEKIRQSGALFWFGLRDVGILNSLVRWKRSRFEHLLTVIQTSRRLDSFLHEAAQNFELLSNIQDQK
jgi:hypothetical protein